MNCTLDDAISFLRHQEVREAATLGGWTAYKTAQLLAKRLWDGPYQMCPRQLDPFAAYMQGKWMQKNPPPVVSA